MSIPPEVLGPFGALVLAILVIGGLIRFLQALWADHLRADADDREQRDAALAGWKAQTDATNRLADAIEQRNARDARSVRRQDPR